MNQIIWHFGFYNEKSLSDEAKKGWLFAEDKEASELAESYTDNAISYIEGKMTNPPKGKKVTDADVAEWKGYVVFFNEWLKKVLLIPNNCELLTQDNKFTDTVREKLRLLIRGHYLELSDEDWFIDYIKDTKKHYTSNKDYRIVQHFFNYKPFINQWRGKLMNATGISICPYCDRQYITSFHSNEKSTAELDHFYYKEEFPLFSFSLFNFIPSCHTCNAVFKGTQQLYLYPYAMGIDNITRFVLIPHTDKKGSGKAQKREISDAMVDLILGKKYDFSVEQAIRADIDIIDLEKRCNELKLPKPQSKDAISLINDDIKNMKIDDIYQSHVEYISDLLKIRRFYESPEYLDHVDKLLKKVIKNNSFHYPVTVQRLRSFLIGAGSDDTNIIPQKRPLAKLTYAILNNNYSLLFQKKSEDSEKQEE